MASVAPGKGSFPDFETSAFLWSPHMYFPVCPEVEREEERQRQTDMVGEGAGQKEKDGLCVPLLLQADFIQP